MQRRRHHADDLRTGETFQHRLHQRIAAYAAFQLDLAFARLLMARRLALLAWDRREAFLTGRRLPIAEALAARLEGGEQVTARVLHRDMGRE